MAREVPPIILVLAGTVVILALSRYFPKIGGWVLLAVVLAVLLTSQAQRAFTSIRG